MFAAAIRHLNRLTPRPDVVLLTGDVTDDGTAQAYAMARDMLDALAMPLLAIPGNHDERAAFRRCFGEGQGGGGSDQPPDAPLHLVADGFGPVRIIGLDVTVPGRHHGDIDDAAAAWLTRTLAADPARPTLIMIHHPPFDSGIPYIDAYHCRRGDRLAAIVAGFPSVERITCGHIHRAMQLRFGGTLLCTAPSTTTAIALRLDPAAEAASYVEPPAMLLHQWRPGTGLISHVLPIGDFPGPMPFA
ncbi:3',5'-cyclic adenosine monophosphate phosphodiesterase CpdA [Tistrella bauzanensis]|uniref:3',5'-cyclic adenosine monophosphate phosphodiesterase CpdA n=1 Tax=Tistrella bauzanensis TaxID=657419 RepID=A0ABQ1J3C2_9PROT|nr:phosphodiesterase [Tistrella bauzanensis]GGB57704.1 3',5'-cyclic adenosine monophosphate phosphodiesterase CpdA [Tistrella bauzanensis]